MRKISRTLVSLITIALCLVAAAQASGLEADLAEAVASSPVADTTPPVHSPAWVPNETGRSWTYVYISERSRTRSGEVAVVEKLKGMRTDSIVGPAPELGEDVYRVDSSTVGRTSPELPDSTERATNFYRATPEGYELVAEQNLDPTTGTSPLIQYTVPLALLAANATPGQRWKVGVRSHGDLHTDLEGEILGFQNVQTPYASFENCLVIRLTGQTTGVVEVYGQRMEVPSGDYSVTRWYAPGVGLVLAKEERSQTLVHEDGSTIEYSERAQFALRSAEPAGPPVPAASE